ncbi:MAG: SURF1 family protein [Bdellovibrionales bacterium]|nr:SURF1 family protein [Bdellovibrionales bacterium]
MLGTRRFSFSWKISLIGAILILGAIRLSYWQWERYLAKEEFLKELDSRLEQPVVPISELIGKKAVNWEELLHRRVLVTGTFDFEHEFIKRNRKDDVDGPGVHVITPLKIDGNGEHILVNRGYIPLSVKSPEERQQFQRGDVHSFVALIKLSETPRSFLAPNDPPAGSGRPWVDAWLRVNIEEIQKQIPYKLLPIHLEAISGSSKEEVEEALVKNSNTRNDIFYLGENLNKVSTGELNPTRAYPVPAFSTVVPSATHLLYVFEWAFMGLLVAIVCIGLQFRRVSSPLSKTRAGEAD